MKRALLLLAALAALAARAPRAHGYCRMSACARGPGTRCEPARTGDCGAPLAWPDGRVSYAVARVGPEEVPMARRTEIVRRAFETWRSVDCGGGRHPRLEVLEAKDEANPISFTESWSNLGTLASTRLGFDPADGAIQRARTFFYWMQLRAYLADGAALDSIALHEAGHFLGLAHSADRQALMSQEVHDGKRFHGALTADDVAAVCAAYPVERPGRGWPAAIPWAGAAVAIALGLALLRRRASARRRGDGSPPRPS